MELTDRGKTLFYVANECFRIKQSFGWHEELSLQYLKESYSFTKEPNNFTEDDTKIFNIFFNYFMDRHKEISRRGAKEKFGK